LGVYLNNLFNSITYPLLANKACAMPVVLSIATIYPAGNSLQFYCFMEETKMAHQIDDARAPIPPNSTRFMHQLRAFIRIRNLSYKTEKTYCQWIKRFIKYHHLLHPEKMGPQHVEQFLHHLVVVENVRVSTQRTALNSLAFLYNKFLEQPLGELTITLSRVPKKVPSVFSKREALLVIGYLGAPWLLATSLMFGAGLRTGEVIALRISDVDFELSTIMVRNGKGNKQRRTLLPEPLIPSLKHQISISESLHKSDLQNGHGGVYIPSANARRSDLATRKLGWQYLLPSSKLMFDQTTNALRRHHVYDRSLQRKVKQALLRSGINKKAVIRSGTPLLLTCWNRGLK
jgi:integrase